MPHFLVLLFLLLMLPLHAGSADAIITGTSASGRTKLELRVQDIDGGVNYAKLTIDGKSYTIKGATAHSGHQSIIHDRKNGIYVITVETPKRVLRFWMIPKSQKVVRDEQGTFESKFTAILEATDPRKKDKWTLTPRITLPCKLNWSI